nr:hypothetical protein [Wolbachia endosymbiont of Kradibia gibbosae]
MNLLVSGQPLKEFSDLIDKIKEHPFNVELINNTLDYEKFKFYLQQDFLYCIDCARAFLIVAARVDDIEMMSSLINLAQGAFYVREQYKNILKIVIYLMITKSQELVLPLLTFS